MPEKFLLLEKQVCNSCWVRTVLEHKLVASALHLILHAMVQLVRASEIVTLQRAVWHTERHWIHGLHDLQLSTNDHVWVPYSFAPPVYPLCHVLVKAVVYTRKSKPTISGLSSYWLCSFFLPIRSIPLNSNFLWTIIWFTIRWVADKFFSQHTHKHLSYFDSAPVILERKYNPALDYVEAIPKLSSRKTL